MEAAMTEMPLALFTTLASIGAGAFIALCATFFTTSLNDEALSRIDRMTTIPIIFLVVGFIAAFFHLASPMNAINVFSGVGTSPLSNELIAGILFLVVALVYWILALTGRLGGGRNGFSAVVAILAVVFAIFMGLAYMIPTIPSWNTPFVPIQMVGFALLGGSSVGVWMIGLAGVGSETSKSAGCKGVLIALTVVGVVLAAGGLVITVSGASGFESAVVSGSVLSAEVTPYMVGAIVCLVIAAVLTIIATLSAKPVGFGLVATILAVIGILLARLAFYSIQISVGIAFS